MPKECLVHVKYKDGHSCISVYRLKGNAVFGLDEMKRWIMEDDPEVVNASVSKVPDHLKAPLKKLWKSKDA